MRDIYNSQLVEALLGAAAITSDATPANGADLQEADGLNLMATIGIFAGLDGSNFIEVIAEDSADDSTYAAITNTKYILGATPTGAGVVATIDAPAEDDTIVRVGYVGPKRYARLRIKVTGTVTIIVSIASIKGYLNRSPAV